MDKTFDVLVVGELNVDLILNDIMTFPEIGREVLANQMTLTLGSSSAIFACNMSNLGASVAFIGKVGKDSFGDLILESLQRNKIDTSLILNDEELSTGVTIILSFDEDRANITYPGAMNSLTFDNISEEALQKAKHLHFSSCFMQPGIKPDLGQLFKSAKQFGLTTSFDMQWDPDENWDLDIESILPFVDVFLPNESELLALTGKNNVNDAIDSLKHLVKVLVIKQGNRGSLVCYQNKLSKMPSFLNEHVVDTIGAGDSFNAGFILKYIDTQSIEECQKFGNLIGALSTMMAGGTKAFEDYDFIQRMAKVKFGITL